MITWLIEWFKTKKHMTPQETFVHFVVDKGMSKKQYHTMRLFVLPKDKDSLYGDEQLLTNTKRTLIQKGSLTLNDSGYLRFAIPEEIRAIERRE